MAFASHWSRLPMAPLSHRLWCFSYKTVFPYEESTFFFPGKGIFSPFQDTSTYFPKLSLVFMFGFYRLQAFHSSAFFILLRFTLATSTLARKKAQKRDSDAHFLRRHVLLSADPIRRPRQEKFEGKMLLKREPINFPEHLARNEQKGSSRFAIVT